MRARLVLFLVFSSSCGGSSEDPAAPTGDATRLCDEVCLHWQSVGCGTELLATCPDDCRAALSSGVASACAAQVNAQYACELERSIEDYTCTSGVPRYEGDSCETESEAARACWASHAGHHPGCERVCELNAAYCIGASEVARCKTGCGHIDGAGACTDAVEAWYDCVANTPLVELTCESGLPSPVDRGCDDEFATVTACTT